METSDSPSEINIDVTNMDVAENNQPMESQARMDANSNQMPTSGPLDRNDPHPGNEESILRNLLNSIIPTDTVEMGAVQSGVAVQAAVNPAEPAEVQGQRAIVQGQNDSDTEESDEWDANNNDGNQDDFSSNPIVRRAVRCFVDERTSIYDYIANKRDHRGELIAERCIMCQEDISTGETVRNLFCGHLFHDQCILPWLVTQLHCPVCRQSLTGVVLETDLFTDSDEGFNGIPVEFVASNDTLRNRALTQIMRQVAPRVQAQLRAEAQARAQAQAIAEAQAIVQAQIRASVQETAETRAIVGVRARTRAQAIAEGRARARAQAVPQGIGRARAQARARAQTIAETRAIDQARARAQAQTGTEAE